MSDAVRATRRAAGLFALAGRGLLEVRGGDRARWLDGMVSNDVSRLAPGPRTSGCYATLLTRTGRIVADLHVLAREDCFWLESSAEATAAARAQLEKFIIADDVTLAERGAEFARFALEGPRAAEVLEHAAAPASLPAAECAASARVDDVEVTLAGYGWSGERAYQILAPGERAAELADALEAAGRELGLVRGDAAALEVLRIEAGVPRFGHELDEQTLPAEARLLERAVSFTKGCYTGQEVVARLHSQGRPSHLLVGLRFASAPAAAGTPLASPERPEKRIGEVTSSCSSPHAGAIGLAFVRPPHDRAGTTLRAGEHEAVVAELPFVAAGDAAS